MAIRILSSENITGNLTLHSSSNAPYIDFVENADTSDSKARITMDQIDTNNGTLLFATENAGTLTNAIIIDSSQNVGIGTTSPDEKLEVSGSVKVGNMKFEPTSGGRIGFNRNTANGVIYNSNYAAFQINGAYSGADFLEIQNYNSSGNFLGSVSLKDGKLGIGTNDPDGKVHIFKNSNGGTTLGTASDELVLENDTDCGLTIRSGADSTGVVSFASPTDHNVGQLYYNHDDDSMVIRTNDAIRTIIGSSGIMYIMGATASTNNSLQLQYNSTAGTAEIYSKSTGGNTTFEFYTSSSGTTTQKFNIGSSGDVKITTNGKFLQGVRTTSGTVIDMIGFGAGTDRLQIKGGTSGGAESIAFFDTAGQMATFYNSRFGIGNTTPKFALNTNLAMEGTSLAYLDGTSNNQTTTNNIGVTHNASGFGGTNGVQGGLFLANNNNANNAPSPIIFFGARSASNTYNHAYAAIYGVKTGGGADSNWNVGELTFATGDGTGPRRRMTIDKDGDVGIGTDSPVRKLDIRTDDGVLIRGASGSINAKLSFLPASGGRQYDFQNNSSNFQIKDESAGITRMFFHYNGRLAIGDDLTDPLGKVDIYRPAGQSGTAAIAITNGESNGKNWGISTEVIAGGDFALLQSASTGGTPTPSAANVRFRINNAGDALFYREIFAATTTGTTVRVPRNLFVTYGGASYSYTFDPVALFGSNKSGGTLGLRVSGWPTRLFDGIIIWRNDGGGNSKIGTGVVTLVTVATNDFSGVGVSVSLPSSNTNEIRIDFSGFHSNDHGWECYIKTEY